MDKEFCDAPSLRQEPRLSLLHRYMKATAFIFIGIVMVRWSAIAGYHQPFWSWAKLIDFGMFMVGFLFVWEGFEHLHLSNRKNGSSKPTSTGGE